MTAERVGSFTPGSAQWHEARAAGLGASEIAAVVGLSLWESRFSLWHRKAGLLAPQQETGEMTWGRYLEAPIAARFADEHPEFRVTRTGTWRSRERPWQLCNPDRFAWPGRVPVEVKWAPYSDGWGESGTDEVPVYYRCQVLWQLDVLGAEFGILVALVGAEYREYEIAHDPGDIELLREAGQSFMDSLVTGERPDITADSHTYRALKALHPDIDGSDVEIPAELASEYRGVVAYARNADNAKRRLASLVLDAMGSARRALSDGQVIATRIASRGSIQLRPAATSKPTGLKVRDVA